MAQDPRPREVRALIEDQRCPPAVSLRPAPGETLTLKDTPPPCGGTSTADHHAL